MQGIGGPAFVAELHTRLPEIPIIVLGDPGNPATAAAHPTVQPPPVHASTVPAPKTPTDNFNGAWIRVLPRPFSMDQLLDLASQMLPQPKLKTA